MSTTPDNSNGEPIFTVTHQFHPLFGQSFPLLSQRVAWGEERVFFSDPHTQEIRSLPRAWTNLALPDPFFVVADGNAVLRWQDLQQLVQFLRQKPAHTKVGSLIWFIRWQPIISSVWHVCMCVKARSSRVFEHTESTARQYALRERALALGWAQERILVIDQDLVSRPTQAAHGTFW
ncbi:MAG: hypothetical protein J2P37_34350 [Ktedonobacteraceae bacterium]|nr:hypothetical protein [Ktedonobacteraceae bacterium]